MVPQAVSQIQTQQSPEVHDAVTVCQAMAQHITDVAGSCRDIAKACSDYAQQIDYIHQEIADEITSFLEWSAGIEAGAAIFSEIGGEVWGQGVEGARIAKTGANIARIIEKLIEFVRTAVQAVRNVVNKIREVNQNLTKIRDARLSKALTKAAQKPPGGIRPEHTPGTPEYQARFFDLTKDPAKNGKISSASEREATVGLRLEGDGMVPRPIIRDPTGRAEFIDGEGHPWDVKSSPDVRPATGRIQVSLFPTRRAPASLKR
ncbi:MAG: hypothetical protein JO287_16590 [Pseudonocardiales bacterium]|nr:hypothetical protein [Pseudonocardiales bacterium]